MKFLLSLLFAICAVQLCFAQSEIPKHQMGIGTFYILSTMGAPSGEGKIDDALVPFGEEIFCSYQFHKRWSMEAGFDFRSRRNTYSSFLGENDVTIYPYNYTTWYLDLPLIADYHFLGKRKFNFNLLFGLKGTWRYYDGYFDAYSDSIQIEQHYHYADYSFNTAFTLGLKESFRISSRVKIDAEELVNNYFTGNLKGGQGGADLKLGLEYILRSKK